MIDDVPRIPGLSLAFYQKSLVFDAANDLTPQCVLLYPLLQANGCYCGFLVFCVWGVNLACLRAVINVTKRRPAVGVWASSRRSFLSTLIDRYSEISLVNRLARRMIGDLIRCLWLMTHMSS